ncbi:MAG TPA: hypothetical protein VNP72_03640 [Longimicrobium sp.]|nr:hypothetical protein [Longimicrobium sp.]
MYRLHRSGGRVKSAGLGLDTLYPEEARLYAEDPSPERAARLRAAFREVQDNPPPRLSAAFFPQERRAVKQHLARAGLYRPFLKTDQGPPGTFLPFTTGEGAEIRPCRIVQREGVAVPEAYVAPALAADPVSRRTVDRVREMYREYRLEECAGAIGELAAHVGYDRREAGVGRGLFFFCNASAADEPVTIPEHVCVKVERIVNELVEGALGKAAHARALYRDGMPLPEALASAQTAEPVEPPLYFQADVYLTLDGDVQVDQIQLPDLGLFLTQLSPDGYAILPQVQRIVRDLRARTMEQLATLPSPTYLLTRPAVLECREDTLEQLEIMALRKMAREVCLDLRVGTPADVSRLPAGAQVLLLNVDPCAPECEALLQRTARGEISCTPDPFLKLLSPELTTLRRVAVRGKQLERFLQTIRAGGQMNAKSYHAFHRAIERIYHHGGHTTDILHVEVPGERTPTPALRHSVHSFTSLYNTCSRNGFPDLWIRDVPVGRENAIVHSDTGPHLAAFRFFFSRA